MDTQADRAERYRAFVSDVAKEPYIMGSHWFQYMDRPPGGRWIDGEDSDYGIVDVNDRPYEKLIEAMMETHKLLPSILTERADNLPVSFDEEAWGEFLTARVPPGPMRHPAQLDPGQRFPNSRSTRRSPR